MEMPMEMNRDTYLIQDSDGKCRCRFCGVELKPRVLMGMPLKNVMLPCECATAQAYWEWRDNEVSRRNALDEQKDIGERKKRYMEALIKSSGIKERFKTRTFKTFKKNAGSSNAYSKAYLYATTFEYGKGRGLFFTGSHGTGKTHLAAAIANHLLDKKHQVIFRSSTDLLDDIKRTYQDSANTFSVIDLFKSADLLIIDDFGKELPTDWALTLLYSIIDSRYECNLPIIITTNYTDIQLIERLSRNSEEKTAKAILSRLYETCDLVEMTWEDYRRYGGYFTVAVGNEK
jgi:DNA replication protein DnaC